MQKESFVKYRQFILIFEQNRTAILSTAILMLEMLLAIKLT